MRKNKKAKKDKNFEIRTCPECNGTGKDLSSIPGVEEYICTRCNGQGKIRECN